MKTAQENNLFSIHMLHFTTPAEDYAERVTKLQDGSLEENNNGGHNIPEGFGTFIITCFIRYEESHYGD